MSRRFFSCSCLLRRFERLDGFKEKYRETRSSLPEKRKIIEDKYTDELHKQRNKINERREIAKLRVADFRYKSSENLKKYQVKLKEKNVHNIEKFREIREELKVKGKELKEKGKEKGIEIKENAREVKERTKERAKRENWYTIPNVISASRIVISPLIFNLIMTGNYQYALYLNIFSAVSDFADGKIARTWPSQQSALGTALDPLADKITMLFIYSAFYLKSDIPDWLFAAIIGRDLSLIIGTSIVRYQTLEAPKTLKRYFDFGLVSVKLQPTWVSKINTAIQFLLPLWLMAISCGYFQKYDYLTYPIFYLTTATTLVSTTEYFILRRDIITGKKVLSSLRKH